MSDETMTPVPDDHPLKVAWDAYRETARYDLSFVWAEQKEHRQGSLWAAFMEGWEAAERQGAREALRPIAALVDAQANDEGLWFRAEQGSEAYLQAALRKLHAMVAGRAAEYAEPEARDGE